MIKIGVFDNTNLNYVYKYFRELYDIDIIKDFQVYNAFAYKNMTNEYDILLILARVTLDNLNKIKHVISKSRIIIFNGDNKELYRIIESEGKGKYIIDYGFNLKASLSISSVDYIEDKFVAVLQRAIIDIYGQTVEPKEIIVYKKGTKIGNNKLLGLIALLILLGYI